MEVEVEAMPKATPRFVGAVGLWFDDSFEAIQIIGGWCERYSGNSGSSCVHGETDQSSVEVVREDGRRCWEPKLFRP